MSKVSLVLAALLAFAAFPVVGVASACINNCNPIVTACVGGVTGACGDGDDVCVSFASSPPFCTEGPGDVIACGDPVGAGFWAAGVSYHDCTKVDGYVCTDFAYYGGGGGGPLSNFVCFESTTFGLP